MISKKSKTLRKISGYKRAWCIIGKRDEMRRTRADSTVLGGLNKVVMMDDAAMLCNHEGVFT